MIDRQRVISWIMGGLKFHNWIVADLERMSGVRRITIERTLKGKRTPQIGTIHRLADAMGVNRGDVDDYLLGRRGEIPLPTNTPALVISVPKDAVAPVKRLAAEWNTSFDEAAVRLIAEAIYQRKVSHYTGDMLPDALRRANLTETQAVHILDEYILNAASYRTTVAELMRGALYLWTVEKVVKANNGQLGQEIELVDHEQDPVQANRDHIGKKAAQQVIEAPRVQIRSDTAGKGDKRSS